MNHELIAELSENAKARIFRFLCKLATSDGEVHIEELKVLEKFRLTFGFDAQTSLQLALESQSNSVALGKSETERQLLIHSMVEIVTADGEFSAKERNRVLAFAKAVGIHAKSLQRLVNKALERNQKTRIFKRDQLKVAIQLTEEDFDSVSSESQSAANRDDSADFDIGDLQLDED